MSWSLLDNQLFNDSNATVTTISISYTVPSGTDTVVLGIAGWAGGSISDPAPTSASGLGATWTSARADTHGSTGINTAILVGANPSAGAGTITVSVNSSFWAANVSSWSGGSSTTDGGNGTTGASSPSITTTSDGDLVIAIVNPTNDYTAYTATGFASLNGGGDSGDNVTIAAGYSIQGTAGSINAAVSATTPAGLSIASDWWSIVALVAGATAPSVSTQAVTNITPSTATGNGSVDSDGGSTITECGVVWSTSPNPTTSDNKASTTGTTGAYSVSMTGLTDDTLYHVRAYAINVNGTSYGADVTFANVGATVAWLT